MPRTVAALLVLAFVPAPWSLAVAADYERRVPSNSQETERSYRTRIPKRDAAAKTAPTVSPDTMASLQERIAALEAQVEALQEIIQVQGPTCASRRPPI